jgi:hypothetical protein
MVAARLGSAGSTIRGLVGVISVSLSPRLEPLK